MIFAFLAALCAFAYVGRFTKYMADDYCLAAAVNTAGFIKPQVSLFLGWIGKYSYTFLFSLAEWIGPVTVPIGPLLGVISGPGSRRLVSLPNCTSSSVAESLLNLLRDC